MPNNSPDMMSYLRVMVGAWRDDTRSDAELLARFAETGDDSAFQALVWRHGTLVWQTCRRILGNSPDVEDAFQTAFMALARKARRLTIKSPAGWLHRVARQAALDVRSGNKRRRGLEQQVQTSLQPKTEESIDRAETSVVLDEELANLPEKLRMPLLLHYIEGKTQIDVARILGCPRSVVQYRLTKGEYLLRKRLEQRGLAFGSASLAMLLKGADCSPSIPAGLIGSTAQAAVAFRAGTLTGDTALATEKLLHVLTMKEAVQKLWWFTLLCSGFMGIGGAGLVAWKMYGDGSGETKTSATASPAIILSENAVKPHSRKVDRFGDPLPEDAIARIGTVRFRGSGMGDGPVALSPDSKILVSSHEYEFNFAIRFWDFATGKQIRETLLKKKVNGLSTVRIAFTPDGKTLVAAIRTGEICQIDTATGQPTDKTFPGNWPFVFTPDSKNLACSDVEGKTFTLYDVGTRKPVHKVEIPRLDKKSDLAFARAVYFCPAIEV